MSKALSNSLALLKEIKTQLQPQSTTYENGENKNYGSIKRSNVIASNVNKINSSSKIL
jgi:hypothetical protein